LHLHVLLLTPETFKPKPLNRLTKMVPGAEERFLARWEQGRVAYDQAWAQWQREEQQRQEQLAQAEKDHQAATVAAEEQHRRVDKLEADFRSGKRAAVERSLTTALQGSQYPAGFSHAFTLIYRSREQELLVGYEFPRVPDIIPEQSGYRYVKMKGLVEAKTRTAADRQRLYKLEQRPGQGREQDEASTEGGATVHPGGRAQAVGSGRRWRLRVQVGHGRRSVGGGAASAEDA
jgi:hypothetical protein